MTDPMARVLFVANSTWNLQHFRQGIIRELVRRGHAVTTMSPDPEATVIDGAAVPHRRCPMHRSSMGVISESITLYRLSRAISDVKPDIAFLFTIKPNIYGSAISRLRRFAAVPNVSGLGTSFLGSSGIRSVVVGLYKLAFSAAARVFFQNPDDRALFVDLGIVRPDKTALLPGSGINLREFAPAPLPEAPRFLMIARLLGDKGVREFLAAAESVKASIPAASFTLLGALDAANPTALTQDELRTALEAGVVDYVGPAADVRPFIRNASVVVLPSYREGLPRSLLEGAAMGRPLIAADVPGCRELVREGVTGFQCDVRSAESLAAAMERIGRLSHQERANLGANARKMVESEYDERIVISAYVQAVEELCSS
jgi:glycosyltransferase involved in cell wall biosynthesis